MCIISRIFQDQQRIATAKALSMERNSCVQETEGKPS